jgi:hypothetical protein
MRKKMFLALLLLSLGAFGQQGQLEVKSTLEPRKIQIGEHATLTFSYEVSSGTRLVIPVFNENITDKIEIINYGTTDSLFVRETGGYNLTRKLTVTSWEEGLHVIEPFEFFLVTGNDTTLILSEPLLLEIDPVLLDEEADLKDVKSIIKAPYTLAELKYYILGVILLILTGWLLWKYLKGRRKPEPVVISEWHKPEIPAHVAAINSLEHLKSLKLWQQGKVKEYHVRLNDIMRHYLEKRFEIHALEMTTSEIMIASAQVREIDPVRKDFNNMLHVADMVKFAKFQPAAFENEWCMDKAFELVQTTRIRDVEKLDKQVNQK